MLKDDTLHRLVSDYSATYKIPLPKLLRATLLVAAEERFPIHADGPLAPGWREQLRYLATIAELQRDWGWGNKAPWNDLKLLRANEAEYRKWFDEAYADAGKTPSVEQNVYRTGVAGRPTSWQLIEDECQRRYHAGERHPGKFGESAAEWARVLLAWLIEKHKDAPALKEKTVASNKLPALLREREVSPRPKS